MRFLMLTIAIILSVTQANAQPPITSVVTSPDGTKVLSGSHSGVAILSWPELKEVGKHATGLAQVNDLAFSPDGKRLLVSGGAPGESGVLEIWSWPEAKRIATASPHGDLIYQAAWNAAGDCIVTASADGIAKLLDAKSLEARATFAGHSRAVLAACWGDEAGQVFTAGADQTIQIWDSAGGKAIRSLSNHLKTVNAIAFRPAAKDGPAILASISEDRTVRLWQPQLPRLMRRADLTSPPRAFVWLTSGDHLAVACNDGTVRFLDFDELKTVSETPGEVGRIHALCMHPQETKLIVGGERGVRAMDIPRFTSK